MEDRCSVDCSSRDGLCYTRTVEPNTKSYTSGCPACIVESKNGIATLNPDRHASFCPRSDTYQNPRVPNHGIATPVTSSYSNIDSYSLDNYQRDARTTAIYPGVGSDIGLTYTLLGLIGETGELANKWKKRFRDNDPNRDYRGELRGELGDVLWYIAMIADELDVSLSELARENYVKLQDRQARNVLKGSGDER